MVENLMMIIRPGAMAGGYCCIDFDALQLKARGPNMASTW